MQNPLLETFDTPFQVPPFGQIKEEHYEPAIDVALQQARDEINVIAKDTSLPSYENTIEALEASGKTLDRVANVLFNLNSAETTDELQKIAQQVSPKLAQFDAEIKQNQELFGRVDKVYQSRYQLNLNPEEQMLLEKTWKSFVRSGASLQGEKQERFKEVSIELSRLTLKFSENVLAETNNYKLYLENESDLSGLPDDYRARAASLAEKNGQPGKWLITLQAPSYIPFMEYADNRELRKQLFKAYMTKAFKNDAFDNQELIRQIVKLRAEKASLLGYPTYASYVLEERMAEKPEKVKDFLTDLLDRALPKAKEEFSEVKDFMKSLGVDHELERWDWAYYSEKLRKKKYDLDDEIVKPYFKLEHVIQGVFESAEKLYDIHFVPNDHIPVYHEDVQAYEVRDADNSVRAVFLADFFPRDGKRPGAWMTSYRSQYRENGQNTIPQVSIVCNFTPSSPSHPSLLKFDEVKTLFHEFGHALHGMLADTKYGSLSGTSVYWDFVELPSQIFENWCYEKQCLDLFAKHHESGETLPEDLIERLRASATYHEAYATVRQISFGFLDMAYHMLREDEMDKLSDIEAFEKSVLLKTEIFPPVDGINMSVQFAHIFAGGYAAGYYSYKWAEVLDADAFALFKEKGIFNKETARSFKDNILSKGGTEPPMSLYIKFRGKEPDPQALLERAGLLVDQ
jgi:peptidyl-dipeptidase Dcp